MKQIMKQWRWFYRADQTCRIRQVNDDGIHVRKNGDLYLMHPGIRPRRQKTRESNARQA